MGRILNYALGIILLIIAANVIFGWYSYEIFGQDITALTLIVLGAGLIIYGFTFTKTSKGLIGRHYGLVLMGILLLLIVANGYYSWYNLTIFGANLTVVSLIVLGLAMIFYEAYLDASEGGISPMWTGYARAR